MPAVPSGFRENLRTLKALSEAITAIPIVAGKAYAGSGTGQAKGIVVGHFTAGNGERYGWQPLSEDYFKRKAGQAKENRKQMRRHEISVTGLDAKASYVSKRTVGFQMFGTALGAVTGRNLPMLVNRGFLRNAVETTAQIERTGPDSARIVWMVPEYGKYHHEGAGNNPKRSPIDPNAQDLALINAAVERFLQQSVGLGRTVAPR